MLYRIKAPDRGTYEELKAALKGVKIEVDLPRYLTIAVEDLGEKEKKVVLRMGGTYLRDYQYKSDLLVRAPTKPEP